MDRHRGAAGPSGLLAKATDVVTRTVAGETLIVPVRNDVGNLEAIFTLNGVGGTIWQLLDGKTSADAVAAAVAREYEVDQAEAQRDVAEFLGLLQDKGLVVARTVEP